MESGKLVLEAADFDLNRELEGLVDMFSVQCVDHDIEIVLDLAGKFIRISLSNTFFEILPIYGSVYKLSNLESDTF